MDKDETEVDLVGATIVECAYDEDGELRIVTDRSSGVSGSLIALTVSHIGSVVLEKKAQ